MSWILLLLVPFLSLASPMSEAGPSLAGFEDLFALANQPDNTFTTRFGEWGDSGRADFGDEEEERNDRSLTNTYPFNQVANQRQQHHSNYQPADHLRSAAPPHHQTASAHHQTAASHHEIVSSRIVSASASDHHQAASAPQFQHFGARDQYNLLPGFGPGRTSQYEHASAPVQHTSVQHAPVQHAPVQHAPVQHVPVQHASVQHNPVPVYQPTSHQPALAAHHATGYQPQSFTPRKQYNLLPGFSPGITSQYEHATVFQLAAPQLAQYEVGDYSVVETAAAPAPAPAPVIAARVSAPASVQRVIANSCPAPSVLPGQCHGQQNECWSVGVPDVDCPLVQQAGGSGSSGLGGFGSIAPLSSHAYCCFNGCNNVCLGSSVRVVAPVPVAPVVHPVVPVNPNRARQPAGPVVDLNIVAQAKERCVDKIELVEETEYEDTVECNHSYDKKCHTSYVTEYDSQQEEECDDNYRKKCDITYSPSAHNVTVEVCTRPLVKDCNLSGPEVCRTEYVSECWTKNNAHIVVDDVADCTTVYEEKCHQKQAGYTTKEECTKWPKNVCNVVKKQNRKYNPETKCEKIPQTLCGPSGCGFVQGAPQCYDKVKTIVTDIPEETCNLEPSRKCEHVTKLVPKLVPVEECVDVPKETCQKTQIPHKVVREVTKKWCYVPSAESGLH